MSTSTTELNRLEWKLHEFNGEQECLAFAPIGRYSIKQVFSESRYDWYLDGKFLLNGPRIFGRLPHFDTLEQAQQAGQRDWEEWQTKGNPPIDSWKPDGYVWRSQPETKWSIRVEADGMFIVYDNWYVIGDGDKPVSTFPTLSEAKAFCEGQT